MPRPKKTVKKIEDVKNVELDKEAPKVAVSKKPAKRTKLILDRTKIEEVEKYVREGKKVHVKGRGAEKKYIVFLEGD